MLIGTLFSRAISVRRTINERGELVTLEVAGSIVDIGRPMHRKPLWTERVGQRSRYSLGAPSAFRRAVVYRPAAREALLRFLG